MTDYWQNKNSYANRKYILQKLEGYQLYTQLNMITKSNKDLLINWKIYLLLNDWKPQILFVLELNLIFLDQFNRKLNTFKLIFVKYRS